MLSLASSFIFTLSKAEAAPLGTQHLLTLMTSEPHNPTSAGTTVQNKQLFSPVT